MTGIGRPAAGGGDIDRRRAVTISDRRGLIPYRRRNPHAGVISEFQPDATELDERAPARASRVMLYCLTILIAAALTWASLAHVDTIVTANGKLITTAPNLTVQPLETSVIREIRVRVGDVVRKGQVLGTLDPTFTEADFRQLETRVSALNAALNRLRTELGGHAGSAGNPTGAADLPSTDQDDAIQAKLLQQRRAFYEARLRNYDAQIEGTRAALKASKEEEALLVQRLETLRSIESMRALLMKKELGSRLNFLLAHDARLAVENNLAHVRGNQADYAHRLQQYQAERQAFIEDFRRTTEQELVDTLAKRNSAAEDLKKAALRKRLVVLRAPVDSVVLDIPNRTIGSVVREAEPMFVLVRRNVPLQAEVRVDGKDVAKLSVGQLVRLKLDAYPFQKFGTLAGAVRVISRDSFVPDAKSEGTAAHQGERQSHASFYRVLVDLRDVSEVERSKGIRPIPGMTLTAEMKVGNRSVISYFLYPLLRGMDESLREP